MSNWVQLLGGLGGLAALGMMGLTYMQGRRKRRDGATGKIVDETERRRHYVEGVYEDQDWEATQHRYWRDAYYRLLEWVQEFSGQVRHLLKDPPPQIPERPPYPVRPARQREDADDAQP